MQNILPLIFIGFFIYLIFSRKGGGIGCCGGHGSSEHRPQQDSNSGDRSQGHMEKVIDLRKDEYTVLPSNADHRSTGG